VHGLYQSAARASSTFAALEPWKIATIEIPGHVKASVVASPMLRQCSVTVASVRVVSLEAAIAILGSP
jgi:hypothetical protein